MRTPGEDLVALLYTDLVAVTRGRLVPAASVDGHLAAGVGWVPANQAINAFDTLVEPNPWGPIGDLRLLPDPESRVRVDLRDDASPLEFMLCDAVETNGRPWDCCPRTLLRAALDDLHDEFGLRVAAAFEHELTLVDERPSLSSFSLRAHRRFEPFGELLVAALRQAGAEPECFLPEYGPNQFEVTCAPAGGVAAADRAVVVRELANEVGRWLDQPLTFAPLTSAGGMANGVHLHLSLVDDAGRSVCFAPDHPGGLSVPAGRFAAGVLAHLPALTAVTAPTPPSRWRLRPHRWSAGLAALGYRNRETVLRIAPTVEFGGADPSSQLHLEFRALDVTASPYLALALLVRAGVRGLREELPCPPVLDRDPSSLGQHERRALGAFDLPTDVESALECLAADDEVRSWMGPTLYECFVAVRRGELADTAELEPDAICRRYAHVY